MENKDESVTIENIIYHYRNIIKWLIVGWVVTVVLIVGMNLIAWCQYDYSSEEITYSQDGEGINSINNGTQGNINNGTENDSKTKNSP